MATAFTMGPGMVAPNVSGGSLGMTESDKQRMWELEDRKEAERRAANAKIMANRAGQQRAAQEQADRGRVWEAFQKMYAPQLQNAYHDTMVQREGVSGPTGIRAPAGVAGYTGSPFSSNVPFGSAAVPGQRGPVAPYRMPQGELDQMLANMWQRQTDPYMRAAASMSGSMPKPPSFMYGSYRVPGSQEE